MFKDTTSPSKTSRPCSFIYFCAIFSYNFLSICDLGDQTDLPFDLLRVLLCKVDRSAKKPIIPPKTSTSFTICPFASPPTAGLHDVLPTDFLSIETKRVLTPLLCAIKAASIPACPPPTTTKSYLFCVRFT